MQAQDTASVAINCRPGLVLTKEIRNLQTGLFQTNIGEVHEGATLTYRINLSNTGNLNLSSNWVKDVLPGNVTYIQDSLSLDGTFQSSSAQADFLSNGLGLGTLTVGASKTLIFQVKVDQCPPLGSFDLINTAYAAGSGLSQLSAQALAHVTVSKPGL